MLEDLRHGYRYFFTSGAQLFLLFFGFKANSLNAWLVTLSLVATISLCAWLQVMKRKRAITDTPTSRIVSAAQGYTELIGTGKPLDYPPLLSHLTSLPCLWYRYEVQERKSDNKWQTISSGESDVSFIIDDGSGRCVVDVDGAEIVTRHKETWTEGRYRNTEWKLLINEEIYALGHFKTIGGSAMEFNVENDVRDLLAEWKKDRTDLLRRFDLNQDGELDAQEWQLARQAARRAVNKTHQEARNDDVVHTLSAPGSRQNYLISNLDQKALARRYLWWCLFHLAVFLGALAAIPWTIARYSA